mmetsp:Transcript_57942/g.137921  ORF Transcript_57942/g.137921 Transcript_57942/m.137921 type:complete len:267 (+) Transcript_57942:166-966(+)
MSLSETNFAIRAFTLLSSIPDMPTRSCKARPARCRMLPTWSSERSRSCGRKSLLNTSRSMSSPCLAMAWHMCANMRRCWKSRSVARSCSSSINSSIQFTLRSLSRARIGINCCPAMFRTSATGSRQSFMKMGYNSVWMTSSSKRKKSSPSCCASSCRNRQLSDSISRLQRRGTYCWRAAGVSTPSSFARFWRTPTLTSSKSRRKVSRAGSREDCVSSGPRISAISCTENDSVRRTFHWMSFTSSLYASSRCFQLSLPTVSTTAGKL